MARAGEVEKGAEEAEVEVEAVFFERVEERGSVDKRRRLDFRSVVVEEEKREESQRFLLPPIELRSLPEHEAMSKAAALLLLLLRCRPAERREASMALREGKFEKIVRELKEEVCRSFSTRLALGERNTKPKKKKTKKPTPSQLFREMPQSSGPPPAGAAFQPLSFAPAVPEDSSLGHLPRRPRNGGYRAPGYGGGGGGRGRGRGNVFASSSMPRRENVAFSSPPSFPSSYPLPPPPATPEERIDQLLERISPTEETDAARAAVFAFLRSVVDRCFRECKVRKKRTKERSKEKSIHLLPLAEQATRASFDP